MKYLFSIVITLVIGTLAIAQQPDNALFSVDGKAVPLSEFEYIYNKNNRDGADYSKASLDEYLDLYIKFKLKVQRAKDMGLDTVKTLQNELAGYRKQLAEGYLKDNEIISGLTRQAYDRMQEDVKFAHVMVTVDQRAMPADTAKAYQKIMDAYQALTSGRSFDAVAAQYSDDGNTKDKGGMIGFLTAMMPSGFYAVESAMYTTPIGQYSAPVRSSAGYHIVKVLDKRPARGKMDAAHILVRVKKGGGNAEAAKQKIDQLYAQIQEGKAFEEVARKYSEDDNTAKRGGFVGILGINQYDQSFEDAAFALENDGDISTPVESSLGWHIIKRMRKHRQEDFDSQKRRLESLINKDERVEAAERAMIERIKKEGDYKLNADAYSAYLTQIEGDLFSFRWQPPTVKATELIAFGDHASYTTDDFGKFIRSQSKTRMRMPKTTPKEALLKVILNDFVGEKALALEESQLADKYPDFKSLMREYEEGILLFEATKINVWDKASSDTAGLRVFHDANRGDYMWPERANVATYILPAGDIKLIAKFKKLVTKLPMQKVLAKLNKKKSVVSYSDKIVMPEDPAMEGLEWKVGSTAEAMPIKEKNQLAIRVVDAIVSPQPKSLSEARGFIIADYQDQLEKSWIETLRNDYKVEVNDAVFNSLIRK